MMLPKDTKMEAIPSQINLTPAIAASKYRVQPTYTLMIKEVFVLSG